MRTGLGVGFIGAALLAVANCSNDAGTQAQGPAASQKKAPVGSPCTTSGDCAEGYCLEIPIVDPEQLPDDFCTHDCTSDADCLGGPYSMVCGVTPKGDRGCVRPCPLSGEFTCKDGMSVACAAAGGSCSDCGCPTPLVCEPSGQCAPQHNVGAPCQSNADCASNNCGGSHVCNVPVGAPCHGEPCDQCIVAGSFSYCCTADSDCNPPCELCPGGCVRAGSGTLSCPCNGCIRIPGTNRHIGQPCTSDEQCASGSCLKHTTCAPDTSSSCKTEGLCSKTCRASFDCDAGSSCAFIPCVAGQDPASCGLKCLADCGPICASDPCCLVGSCDVLAVEGASSVSACEFRAPNGAACGSDADCQSTHCISGACYSGGGARPVGAECVNPADCQSGNCLSGFCYGTGKFGDPCTTGFECASGRCNSGSC